MKTFDICLLQETHSTREKENIWISEWGNKIYFSHGTSNSRGVCILFRPGFNYTVHDKKGDEDGRVLCLDIEIEDIKFTLSNIYAPNEDDQEFFKHVFEIVEQFDNSSKIIAGDFNLVMDLEMDKKGGNPRTHFKCRDIVKLYMEESDMLDIWRQMHPDTKKYTWHRNKIFCRLDMILTSFDLTGYIENSNIIPSYKSDHSIVTLELDLHQERRGKGLWKLNTTFLNDQDYVNLTNKCIIDSKNKYSQENPGLKWELIKMEVTGSSIRFSKNKAKSKKNILEALEKRLHRLESERDKESDLQKLPEIEENINLVNGEIEKFVSEKTKGHMFRSKVKWYKEGEKSSKYFFNLEKANYSKKVMKTTYLADGSRTKDPNKILKEQRNFFTRLLTSNENVDFDLDCDGIPKLNERDKKMLEKDITIGDLYFALKDCKNDKTPGCDGLPVEFYKMFWPLIKDVLHDAITYAYKKQSLHISARRGIISLIPKKDKDLNYIKNWRPLTLLNTDYKILAKTLAKRLKLCLDKLINKDQTGFMKNRFIGENIRKILDILEYTENEQIPAILISIDFEKCFDRLEWPAIYKTMENFNFGNKYINWVKLLYNNTLSCTTNNGHSSDWFKPSRGLRQGCPLSPYLYLLCGEIFANLIRKSKDVKGIPIGDTEAKISQYADDTNLFSMYEKSSLDGIISIFKKIEDSMGLKINYDKTNIYIIGSIRDSLAKLYTQKSFKWENAAINVLGIDISCDNDEVVKLNYDKVLKNISKIVELWENRNLSLIGKVLVVNTLMGSHFVYKLSALESPSDDQKKQFNDIITNYIWNRKRPKIKRNILVGKKDQGGLKLVDIEKKDMSLKIQWVRRIIDSDSISSKLAYYFLPKIGHLLWQCNLKPQDVDLFLCTNNFWRDVMLAWCSANFECLRTREKILNGVIWYNSEIRIRDKPIFYKRCYEAGMIYVKDI